MTGFVFIFVVSTGMKINHTVKILSDPLNSGLLKEEEKAAEDFEQIADLEYQLDFGID